MSESLRYVVVGAGMQGTAAAFDLARFGDAASVVLADADAAKAEAAAARVDRLSGRQVGTGIALDAKDVGAIAEAVRGADAVLSCVPYKLHATVEEGCFEAGASVLDMGNDTDVTLRTLERDAELAAKGITFVPDAGLAPGLVNSIGAWFLETMDTVDSVRLFCGGLPQRPVPPFNYTLRFSIEGLVGEYVDEAIAIREHEVVRLDTLTELEEVEVPGLGRLEAFTTSSGTSTAPYTFRDKVRNYEYKTLRYPGHCAYMQVFRRYGFWEERPIDVKGRAVVPLDFFCALMGDQLSDPEDRDLVAVHAEGVGTSEGRQRRILVDILDRHDEATGFTSMERLTGFSAAIVAIEIAHRRIRPGAVPYELAMPGGRFLGEIRRRGITVSVRED